MQDGNIHCHIDNLSRRSAKNGERIAVATAAYNAGEHLWSEREERHVDFGNRADVVFSRILLPEDAPGWAADRESLWNRVDMTAQRKDARLAKSIVAAITRDIPTRLRPALLEQFAAPFVALGCVADIAIHEDGTGHNPHVHVLLTTRMLAGDGFAAKITALEQRAFVKQVRQRWADLTNVYLEKSGSALRVDHRSYKARGIGAEPTVHRGPDPNERRIKREHARRVREERTMAEPDRHDRQQYPLLTQRGTWPPEPAPSTDLTSQERDEHHRYWQDRKLDRIESVSLLEPQKDSPDFVRHPEPPVDVKQIAEQQPKQAWWEQALDNAHQQHAAEQVSAPIRRYEETVRERAQAMETSQQEREALAATAPEQRTLVTEYIMQERMRAVRDRDRAEHLRRLPPDLRRKLEALRWEVPGPEQELPVPGPDRELLSQRELQDAQDRMLDDYLQEERERDR